MKKVEKAIEDFKLGRPVLIYDWPNREDEVDMVYYAGIINPSKIYELRTKAGGMICFGTNKEIANVLGLSLVTDLLKSTKLERLVSRRASYGDVSPFTLWVNSVETRTGISDIDRAKTVSKLHKVTSLISDGKVEEGRRLFYEGFYAPGHVPILIAKDLKFRKGHTELSVQLARLASLKPSVVFAEMLNHGTSMSLKKARKYAEERDLALVTGEELLRAVGG